MNFLSRLLASLAVGVAHFALTLYLGPSINCAEVRGCPETQWIQPPQYDVFALPLSAARDSLTPFFDGRSFLFYSAANAFTLTLIVLSVLCLFAWLRAKL